MGARGRKSSNRARALEMFFTHPDMSDGAIAATLNVSRQLVSRWHAPVRKAAATESSEKVADEDHRNEFVGGPPGAAQLATPGTVLERQRLVDLADEDEQLAVMLDKILRGSAPRAAAIAVGITSHQFGKRMESDALFRDLVLRAAHEAESSVAQNLYRAATGNSPQNVQAALGWLEKRHPELWGREAQRIEIELTGAVDVNHILSSPALIAEANAHEARLQQIEDEAIEGEFRELPAFDAPPLPNVVLDENPIRVNRVPGQQGLQQRVRPMREIVVNGVRTLVSDERGPGGDNRPPF